MTFCNIRWVNISLNLEFQLLAAVAEYAQWDEANFHFQDDINVGDMIIIHSSTAKTLQIYFNDIFNVEA